MRAMYDHLVQYQEATGFHCNKGTPLLWIAECHRLAGHPVLSQRFLMLTLCDDAIASKGIIAPGSTGVLFRLRLYCGMTDHSIHAYAQRAYQVYMTDPAGGLYPEWIIQELDDNWITSVPSAEEALLYLPNRQYLRKLLGRLGTGGGKPLERVAEYMMSVIPGCRTKRDQRTPDTQYDVVCSLEGAETDFRAEIGRYFVCECKDWDRPADFTAVAKFVRVLQGAKARFGILFSRQGITSEGKLRDAALEQRDAFRELGIVVVVADERDLNLERDGSSFLAILREKYQRVRLGLI